LFEKGGAVQRKKGEVRTRGEKKEVFRVLKSNKSSTGVRRKLISPLFKRGRTGRMKRETWGPGDGAASLDRKKGRPLHPNLKKMPRNSSARVVECVNSVSVWGVASESSK